MLPFLVASMDSDALREMIYASLRPAKANKSLIKTELNTSNQIETLILLTFDLEFHMYGICVWLLYMILLLHSIQ